MKKIFLFLLIFSFSNSYACAENKAFNCEVSFPRAIFNFHIVKPGVMRGSQPSAKALQMLKDYLGVKTILCLRQEKEIDTWEKQTVEGLGMKFINVPIDSSEEQSIAVIERCLEIISDKSAQPVFVHCAAGKDRTGMVIAAYRIKYDHWSFEDALTEMRAYGYDSCCCSALERSLSKWNNWRSKQARSKIHEKEAVGIQR